MKKYILKNCRNILKYVFIAFLAFSVYAVLHSFATLARGYEAIGGEIFALFLLALMWVERKKKR